MKIKYLFLTTLGVLLIAVLTAWYIQAYNRINHEASIIIALDVGRFAREKGYLPRNWEEFCIWDKKGSSGMDPLVLKERYKLNWGEPISSIYYGDVVLVVLSPSLKDIQGVMNDSIISEAKLNEKTNSNSILFPH